MEKENQWQELYREVCLFFVLLGMFLCMEKLLEPAVSLGALCLTAAALVVVSGIMGLGRLEKQIACLLFFAFQCFVAAGYHGYLLVGAKAVGNQVLELYNYNNRTGYLLWYLEAEEPGKSLFFLMLCSILGFLGILLSQTPWGRRRRLASLAICPAFAVLASLSLGRRPSGAGIILLLAGLAAGQIEVVRKEARPMAAAVYASLGLGALFAVSPLAGEALTGLHDTWLLRQLHLEDAMLDALEQYGGIRLFANAGAQTDYRLENGEPDITGREALTITVKQIPEESIYLKGFVGGDYENGRWKGVSKQAFSDWAQQQGYTAEEYQEIVRNYPYQFLARGVDNVERGKRKADIALRRSTRGYTLAPYFSEISEGQPQEADGSLEPQKQRKFQWRTHLALGDAQRLLYNNMYYYAEGDEKATAMQSYREYAYQAYTRLPVEGLERLWDFARVNDRDMSGIAYAYRAFDGAEEQILVDGMGNGWMEKRLRLVQELLWEDTQYSLDLEGVPQGADFVEYFLLDQKKGYCTHYATAGTLLLRMYGVPARFVMGYLVLPSDFKENPDGTYTATLTDARGHAWTEVYQENVGFCPIEMTPPSYVGMLEEMDSGQDMRKALAQQEEAEKKGEAEKKEEEEKKEEKEEEEAKKEQGQKGEMGKNPMPGLLGEGNGLFVKLAGFGKAAVLMLALIAILAAAFFRLRSVRMQKRRDDFSKADRTAAVRAIGARMAQMLKILGLKRQAGMGDQEYGAILMEAMPELGWGRAIGILQKAAFSQQGVTEEEYEEILKLYGKLDKELRREKGKVRGCLYDCWK